MRLKKPITTVLDDDGRVAYVHGDSPTNQDVKFCLMVTQFDEKATGIKDPGGNYILRATGDVLERFGDWNYAEPCPKTD